jgi:uncharacterized membrane protein
MSELPTRSVAGPERSALLISAILAATGAALAGYLAAYQLGLVSRVWDPLFGSTESQRVLHSFISRKLPIPDAALGAGGYALEATLLLALLVLTLLASPRRSSLHEWLKVAYGAVAIGMGISGAFLVGVQILVLHSFCSLCLMSATISWALALLSLPILSRGLRSLVAFHAHRRTA